MKFKKLISLLATFAITSTMITLPVKAAVNFDWHMDESAVKIAAHSAPAQNAYAGKEYGYTYGFTGNATYIGFTESFNDNSKKLPLPENYQSYEGYMLISMNVYSPAGQQFQFQAMDGQPITPNYTVSTGNGFSINKWNKMLAVVKLSATKANRDGYWYINGEKKDAYHSTGHLMFDSETYNKVRLKTNKNNTALYIDDVHVAFTTDALTNDQLNALAAMPTLTTLSGSTVTVGSVDKVTGTVTVAHGTTLANLQAKNTNTLTAYNSALTTPVAQNTALQNGDVIIATDSLGKMSYFNVDVVGENYSWWHMDESAVNSATHSAPAQNAYAGKEYGYTYGFTGNTTYIGFTESFNDNSKKLPLPDDYTSYEGYMLISMNVYSPAGQQFQFLCWDGQPFTPNVTVTTANGFNINRWNKMLAVVKLSATKANRTGYYYINGVKKSWTSSGHLLFSDTSAYNRIRLKTQKNNTALYIDDVYVTFTTDALTTAQLDALAAMPTLGVTSDAYVTGNTVDVLSNVTPANLQAKNANTVTAYTDSTFATPVASGTALSAGNIVISTDSFGKMSYYDVTANNAPYVKDSGATVANYTVGNMTFGRKLFVDGEKDLMVIAAQYSSDENELKKFTSKTDRYSGYVDLSEDLGITETSGTKVKLFVWQKSGDEYSAFCNPISYNP